LRNTRMGFFVDWRLTNPLAAQVPTGVATPGKWPGKWRHLVPRCKINIYFTPCWYGSRPPTRPHYRRGPSSPRKLAQQPPPPSFRPISIAATVAHLSYCWALVWLWKCQMLNVGPNLTDADCRVWRKDLLGQSTYGLQRCLFVFARWHNYLSAVAVRK